MATAAPYPGRSPVARQQEESEPWALRFRELANHRDEVHVLMNNCYQDYAVVNARQLGMLL